MLKGIAGMTDDDIAAKRGIGYAKSVPDSLALLDERRLRRRLHPAPHPGRAGPRRSPRAGENMPPKSTYFFPKVMTGMVFNPVG